MALTSDHLGRSVAGLHVAQGAIGVFAEGKDSDLYAEYWGFGILRGSDDFQANLGNARADWIDDLGGFVGEVDDAAVDEGTAIDDTDFARLRVAHIGYTHPGIEGQGAMGGDHRLHVVDLAIGSLAAVIGVAVPAGEAGLGSADDRWDGLGRGLSPGGFHLLLTAGCCHRRQHN